MPRLRVTYDGGVPGIERVPLWLRRALYRS